jgi:hypothetical protein
VEGNNGVIKNSFKILMEFYIEKKERKTCGKQENFQHYSLKIFHKNSLEF